MSPRIKRIRTLKQIWEFLEGTAATDTVPSKNRAEAYRFIVETWSASSTTTACRGPARASSSASSRR